MKLLLKCVSIVFLLAGMLACGGQKGAKLQNSVIPADKTLFQNGEEFLKKSQFINARLAFQTLIRTYPGSDYEAEAYLATGDSFYQEGGTENLLMAEDQYRNFIIFFPTNPKAADAQMKIVSILMRQMRAPDRDQSYAVRAEAEINRMLTQFPNSDYIPVVKGFLDEVQESLALSDYGIGDYYAQHGNPWGASSRFKEITEKYARFSKMDEVDFLLAQSLLKMENTDEAVKFLTRIAEGYPYSKYFDQAKAQLQKMGKPVPEVNPQLAAQNEALLKPPEPFSPLRPLIQFAEAIGFKGPADRFTQAQRVIAARKAEAEAAAAAANKPQTSTDGGEVLINATLKQNTNGQTVGGTSTNVTPAKTDKKVDTKKQDDTTKKKKKSE